MWDGLSCGKLVFWCQHGYSDIVGRYGMDMVAMVEGGMCYSLYVPCSLYWRQRARGEGVLLL